MKLKSILTAAVLAAAGFLSPGRADAQRVDTLRVSTALWTACPGGTVRLAVRSPETVIGRCGSVADGRLLVQTQDSTRQVELSEVRGLWVRKSRIAESTVLLALAGFVVGYSIGVPGEEPVCVPGGCTQESRTADNGRGAGVGVVAGAALGLIVGSRIIHWDQRYP